jgi:hypothetical protein
MAAHSSPQRISLLVEDLPLFQTMPPIGDVPLFQEPIIVTNFFSIPTDHTIDLPQKKLRMPR